MSDIKATPEELDLIRELMAEAAAQDAAKNTPVTTPVVTAPQPIKMKIGDQDIEFKDLNDVQEKFNETIKLAQAYIRDTASPSTKAGPQATVKGDDSEGFNFDKFSALMGDQKVEEGFQYVLDHNPAFKEIRQTAQAANAKLAAYEFRDSHPELARLDPRVGANVGGVIDATRQEYNFPMTKEGLEAAYQMAQVKQKLPNFAQYYNQQPQTVPGQVQGHPQNVQNQGVNPWQAPQYPPTAGQYNNPYLAPNGTVAAPPVVNRGTADNFQMEAEDFLENMSIQELEAFIARGGRR